MYGPGLAPSSGLKNLYRKAITPEETRTNAQRSPKRIIRGIPLVYTKSDRFKKAIGDYAQFQKNREPGLVSVGGSNFALLTARTAKLHHVLLSVARPEGFEPPTSGLEIRCSIRLSYGRPVFRGGTYGKASGL